jgi:hypothetical protein
MSLIVILYADDLLFLLIRLMLHDPGYSTVPAVFAGECYGVTIAEPAPGRLGL